MGTPSTFGKIKILENFQGTQITKALPSMPVIVLGFEKVPQVGEKFKVFLDFESAQNYVRKKERKREEGGVFFVEEGIKVLNLILKADVVGSLEALEKVLESLPQEKIVLRILKKEVGEISESDLKLAQSAKAKVIGFRVKINPIAKKVARLQNIKILVFDVIYDLIQAVREMMEKALRPKKVRIDLGKIKTLVIFKTEKNRQIIGGRVLEGKVKKGVSIEVFRNEELRGRGKLINLQKERKDIPEAGKREEVGILYEGDVKIEVGDTLVIYTEEKIKEKL